MKCWCTIPTPAPIASFVLQPVTSRPSTSTVPSFGANSPASTRISVDLPAPFSPTIAWISPRATSRVASRLATQSPKAFRMPVIRTAGVCPAAATPAPWWTGALIACSEP